VQLLRWCADSKIANHLLQLLVLELVPLVAA
jgi:hypothetical protein